MSRVTCACGQLAVDAGDNMTVHSLRCWRCRPQPDLLSRLDGWDEWQHGMAAVLPWPLTRLWRRLWRRLWAPLCDYRERRHLRHA